MANGVEILRRRKSVLELERMPNRLAHEKSPYLLQHADNPVNWYPWGEEAFALARALQKPIFLSIGYSTCHWCHVMARESFENAAIATLLNDSFVAIKVDREERPDVDHVYMTYVQAATGAGGWPLNVWLTPELKPFYGGTYFPPEDRPGRHGLGTVLNALAHGWSADREQLVAEGDRVLALLEEQVVGRGGVAAVHEEAGSSRRAAEAFGCAFHYFRQTFDQAEGGFGRAPKFPRAACLNFLFRVAAIKGQATEEGREALAMAELTLRKMAQGGIHDQVGGGFHRYSVDGEWFVPHFEKMLYDQAQIAICYLEAFQASGHPAYTWIARDALGYVLRDLAGPQGGFFSAEDADSLSGDGRGAHAEGAFYLWTQVELRSVLGVDADLVMAFFNVEAAGNVSPEHDPQGEFRGQNLLRQKQSLAVVALQCGLTTAVANERIVASLKKLHAVRDQRTHPHLDDKIVTAWNGLAISALARTSQVMAASEFLDAAVRTAGFLEREMYDDQRGVLFRSFRFGRGKVEAFAEDYAFLVQGLIDLYEATFDHHWLQWALRLQQTMDALFWDPADGGYFNSVSDDGRLVLRLKEDYDGAEPAASSVAAMNLARLAPVSGDEQGFRERAAKTVGAFLQRVGDAPQAIPQMLCALELVSEPARQVILAGDPRAPDFHDLAAVLHEKPGAKFVVYAADGAAGQQWLAGRAPWMAEFNPVDGRATAYLCEHYVCRMPVTRPEALRAMLR